MLGLVAVAPAAGNGEGPRRRQQREQALVEARAEHLAQQVELLVQVPEAVAVTNQEPLAVNLEHLGFVVHHHPHLLLQIVEHPHVVVAEEEVQLHPAVGQLGQLAQQARVATRHRVAVGEPEVEYVAQQEQRLAVALDAVEEAAQLPLTLATVGTAAQMGIRDEIG